MQKKNICAKFPLWAACIAFYGGAFLMCLAMSTIAAQGRAEARVIGALAGYALWIIVLDLLSKGKTKPK